MKSVDQGEIDLFLKRHEPVSSHEQFCAGELFDDWQITAFLGRGGGGEVDDDDRNVGYLSQTEQTADSFSLCLSGAGTGVGAGRRVSC